MKYIFIIFAIITYSQVSFAAEQVPFSSDLISPIKNYNRATPLLATSGVLGDVAIQELAAIGITTIINLKSEAEGAKEEGELAKAAGITYINIPVNGGTLTDDKILAELTSALDNVNTPTLLHCGSGNRVGAMLTRYYLGKGLDVSTAFNKGRTAGMKPSLENIIQEDISAGK